MPPKMSPKESNELRKAFITYYKNQADPKAGPAAVFDGFAAHKDSAYKDSAQGQ